MERIVEDQAMQIDRLTLGPYATNAYIVVCRKTQESLVVDVPAEAERIQSHLQGTQPRFLLLTHDHPDHIGALSSLRRALKIPLAAHPDSAGRLLTPPEIPVKDGDRLTLGRLSLRVLHTPGHTAGSLCFLIGKYLLAGDTLFPGGPGHTSSPEALRNILSSITEKLFLLPDETVVLPGHGPETTVGRAKEEYAVFASKEHPSGLCGDVLWLSS